MVQLSSPGILPPDSCNFNSISFSQNYPSPLEADYSDRNAGCRLRLVGRLSHRAHYRSCTHSSFQFPVLWLPSPSHTTCVPVGIKVYPAITQAESESLKRKKKKFNFYQTFYYLYAKATTAFVLDASVLKRTFHSFLPGEQHGGKVRHSWGQDSKGPLCQAWSRLPTRWPGQSKTSLSLFPLFCFLKHFEKKKSIHWYIKLQPPQEILKVENNEVEGESTGTQEKQMTVLIQNAS